MTEKYEPNRRIAGYEDIVRRAEDCSYLTDSTVESIRQTYRELDSSQEYVIADFRHNAIIFQD